MANTSSVKAVVAALSGNAFVTVTKFFAFLVSGSPAMLSEAIHSLADTGNQLLLFIGLRRGEREADDRFHYGYGGERFIFGILSAAGIFFIGCGITIYHGIASLMNPHVPHLTVVTFVVLGLSLLIEGAVLLYAIRGVNHQRGKTPFFKYVREFADPATVAILLEDGAAVLGVLVAAGTIVASYLTGNPVFDSIGSLIIGTILGLVAFYLVVQNRELLLGRAVPPGQEEAFTQILLRNPCVRSVRDIKTRQLTPDRYLFKAEITIDTDYLAEQMAQTVPSDASLAVGRTMRRLAMSATSIIATETAAIEKAVRAEIPFAKHIDLEIADPNIQDDDEELA